MRKKIPEIALILSLISIGWIAWVLIATRAQGAEEISPDCQRYGADVERLVLQLTNDVDVSQAARAPAEKWCFVIGPALIVKTDQGTAPATGAPAPKSGYSGDWAAACAKRYHSFDPATGTVKRYGSRTRVICPIAK